MVNSRLLDFMSDSLTTEPQRRRPAQVTIKCSLVFFFPGAFLIPYLLFLGFVGVPLYFLELSVGQFTQGGPIRAWTKMCPLSAGEEKKRFLSLVSASRMCLHSFVCARELVLFSGKKDRKTEYWNDSVQLSLAMVLCYKLIQVF